MQLRGLTVSSFARKRDVAASSLRKIPEARNALNDELRRDLEAHCRDLIAGYKCPKSWDIRVEPLPLSSLGKVNKARLREEASSYAG